MESGTTTEYRIERAPCVSNLEAAEAEVKMWV